MSYPAVALLKIRFLIKIFFFSFSFLFLESISVSNTVLGLSMCTNGLSGALFYVVAGRIIDKLGGNVKAMALSCFFWAMRYVRMN